MMPRYLVDTNVVVSAMAARDALTTAAVRAIEELLSRNEDLCVSEQVLIEFWCVATRPREANGLGLAPSAVAIEVDRLVEHFRVIEDVPGIFSHWRRLVQTHGVTGGQVFDARLVATMLVHGVDHILTFNGRDFERYKDIVVVDPRELARLER